jgi:hypothetical protein
MQGEYMHRALDAVHRMLAEIVECARHLSGHLVACRERDRDTADRRERLQSRRDVHAFAINVIAFDDDIAKVNADPVLKALRSGALLCSTRRRLLDGQCAFDGRNNAAEFDQRTVTHELDNAPTASSDAGIEDLASIDLQPFERAGLVGLHQAAVVGDVG